MHGWLVVVACALALGLAGCSGAHDARVMPDVVGKQLDAAKSDIKNAGFTDKVQVKGGGVLGIVVDSNWQVCDQHPAAGEPMKGAPQLTVDRSCTSGTAGSAGAPAETKTPQAAGSKEPSATPAAADPQSSAPTPVGAAATDITVDALYDKLNSAGMGGVQVGDRFRLTTQFVGADVWAPTVSGDFGVFVQDAGGASHMEVLAKKSDAATWREGMKVEMVVESVELTINGETGSGYMRVVSAKAIP